MKSTILVILSLLVAFTSAQLVLPGGEHALATNDEMLVRVLAEVEPVLNSQLNSPYLHRITHVVKASAQIVNGLIYHVTFELGQTGCFKSDAAQQKCDAVAQVQQCTAKIFSQPWEHITQLSELQCGESKKIETPLEGALHEVDTEDESMKHALLAVEHKMSYQFNSIYVSQVGKVLEAKSQIVAGIKYYLTFKFGQTYQLKANQATEEQPHRRSEVIRKFETCHAQIWAKPGGQQFELLEFRCDVSGEFYAGGVKTIAVSDAEMLVALRAIVDEANVRLHTTHHNTLGKVIEAKSQIVAGVKYFVTFEFGQTMVVHSTEVAHQVVLVDRKICYAEIWVQPQGTRELTSLQCNAA